MKRKRIVLTATAFLITLCICLIFVYILAQNEISESRKKIAEISSAQAYTLQRQLDRSLSATYALAAYIHQFGGVENFDELAADMIERYGGISSLQLAPDAVVRQIYPLEGNEAAIGHDLLNDPKRRIETLKAIESGRLTLAGPFTLVQGGVAVIGRYPVFVHEKNNLAFNRFWGFAIALIHLSELIKASNLNQLVAYGYDYTLSRIHPDTSQPHIFVDSGKELLSDPVTIEISVPNGTWTLSVSPADGWLPGPFLVSGILLSVFLSFVIAGLFHRQIKYSLELSESNAKLNEEIDHHKNTARALNRALAESEQSEKRFRAVAQTATDGIITVNSTGHIVYMNERAESMFGYPSDTIMGAPLISLIPDEYHRSHITGLSRATSGSSTGLIGKTVEVNGKRKDGSPLPIELSLAKWGTEEEVYFTAIIRDITERKNLEKEILGIEDRERRRISYDLHDDLGQLLTGISFKSSSLEDDLKDKKMPEADEASKIAHLIENAKDKVKLLSKWIAPVDHDEQGLAPALEDLASNTRKIFNIQCGFSCETAVSIKNAQVTTNLYRIAQEAVNNAVRHSKATNIEITLTKEKNSVIMTVRDNGKGLDASAEPAGGMGIRIMNYRAGIIGATLVIGNNNDGGTCVTCTYSL